MQRNLIIVATVVVFAGAGMAAVLNNGLYAIGIAKSPYLM